MTPKILVAEDEPEVRFLYKIVLSQDYEVLEAGDGRGTLEMLERGSVDLLLLDLRMPGVDGWGVLDTLDQTGRGRPPTIVVSAHASPSTIQRALERGCIGYLKKPFTPDELRTAIRDALPVVSEERYSTAKRSPS